MADELRRARNRNATQTRKQERAALLASIKALSDWVGFGLVEAVPVPEQRSIVGDSCPEPDRIPIKALRRLHEALRTFMDEALAAERAKLQREVGRGA